LPQWTVTLRCYIEGSDWGVRSKVRSARVRTCGHHHVTGEVLPSTHCQPILNLRLWRDWKGGDSLEEVQVQPTVRGPAGPYYQETPRSTVHGGRGGWHGTADLRNAVRYHPMLVDWRIIRSEQCVYKRGGGKHIPAVRLTLACRLQHRQLPIEPLFEGHTCIRHTLIPGVGHTHKESPC
jgi:hypothetical protein